MDLKPLKKGSVFLAPMESVTDDIYRTTVEDLFGAWDYYCSDFLRLPSDGVLKKKFIRNHYGEKTYEDPILRQKTCFQILASERSSIERNLELFNELDIHWIDLNLGCPSKKVNSHKGGAYLLQDLDSLQKVVSRVRKAFKKRFTAKIRIGYHDDKNFESIIKILEDLGVEAITIHGRTRDQAYKGNANWSYIKKATEMTTLPIIGNGDVWLPHDIKRMFDETNCHSVMVARGALKTPWMAKLYKTYSNNLEEISQDEDFLLSLRSQNIYRFFSEINKRYSNKGVPSSTLLRFDKNLSRYLFDDFQDEKLKQTIFRSLQLEDFEQSLRSISEQIQ